MYEYKAVGERIKQKRKQKKYTRETLAELLDITPRFLYDIECGSRGISVETLVKISSALDITVDYILFGEPYGKPAAPSDILRMIEDCPEKKKDMLRSAVRAYVAGVNKNVSYKGTASGKRSSLLSFDDAKDIGTRISYLRELEGYSKDEIAHLLDVTQRFIYDIELGNKGMSVETLIGFCREMNVSADLLIFGAASKIQPYSPETAAIVKRCPENKFNELRKMLELFMQAYQADKENSDKE